MIKALVDENYKELQKSIKKLKMNFLHENIKEVFPSMKYSSFDDEDYTLLLLENITLNVEFYNFVNEVMQEDMVLNKRLDKILKHMFSTTSPELRHSLCAIRSGTKEIDFHLIVKEGF